MRYRLVADDSGHHYALPVDMYWPINDKEFEEFEVPDEAISIDGRFTFSGPLCS